MACSPYRRPPSCPGRREAVNTTIPSYLRVCCIKLPIVILTYGDHGTEAFPLAAFFRSSSFFSIFDGGLLADKRGAADGRRSSLTHPPTKALWTNLVGSAERRDRRMLPHGEQLGMPWNKRVALSNASYCSFVMFSPKDFKRVWFASHCRHFPFHPTNIITYHTIHQGTSYLTGTSTFLTGKV